MSLRIDVWSDIACPWCYVGKRRLEAALARDGGAFTVTWHAFELDPSAPRVRDEAGTYAERLAAKYRTSTAQGQAMIDRMTDTAATDGIAMRFDQIRPGNTFDAHRLIHLGHERGMQDAVKERFLRGYLCEGEPIGEPEVLVRLARDAGLDPAEVSDVVTTDRYAEDVRRDQAEARELGITGVPFFVLGGRVGLSGAQTPDVITGAIAKARALAAAAPELAGEACGPDGC
ncbi:MAG: DsbA family oxidoreductase [Kofleriaceae bacterium]